MKKLTLNLALAGGMLLGGCAQEPAPVINGYNGTSLRPMAANTHAPAQTGPAQLQSEPAELPAPSAQAAEATVPDSIAMESIEPAAGPARTTATVETVVPTTAQRPVATAQPPATPAKPAVEMVKHVVGPTDTVYSLAGKYESSASAILKQNNMRAVSDIRAGQVLVIPAHSHPRTSLLDQMKQALAAPQPKPLPVAGQTAQAAAASTDMAAIEPAAGPAVASLAPVAGGMSPDTKAVASTLVAAESGDEIAVVSHKVEQGETIYRISRTYGASVLDIMAANEFETPQDLKYGTLVRIPVKAGTQAAEAAAKTEPAAGPVVSPAALQAPKPVEAVVTAKAEEVKEVASVKADDTQPVEENEKVDRVEETAQKTAAVPAEQTEEAEKSADVKAAKPQVASVADDLKAEMKRGQVDPVAARSEGKVWPVKGKILRRFGQDGDGATHTGINIAVPPGTPVLATDTGTVLYADEGLKTYGKLVLLRHKDGTVSAYAHNGHLLVRKGETVKKGQVIAMSGASGNVDVPQLHFELRQHASAVDPMRVLPQL